MVLVGDEKPVPRHPRSASQRAHVQARNRRREYLRRHPSYFSDPDHLLAAPLLHERLVARFSRAPCTRTVQGFARALEADLARNSARLIDTPHTPSFMHISNDDDSVVPALSGQQCRDYEALYGQDCPWNAPAENEQHGLELWLAFVGERFVRGADQDFDYTVVDGDDDLDSFERNEAQDRWFDDEEPSWAHQGPVSGQTGIQDF